MIETDLTFFALAIPAVLFAGISKGGFGSGAAFAATPILALILEPGQAVGMMLPLLMMMDVTALKPYWRKWDWPSAKMMIIGCVPGIALGGAFYQLANPDVFRVLIGLVALGFVAWQVARAKGWVALGNDTMPNRAGIIAGIVGGFTSFVSHAGGPPAAVFLLSRGLSKTEYQATSVIVFWVMNGLKFIPYFLLGIFSWQIARIDLLLMPFAVIGVWLGVKAHDLIPERIYFAITYVLLIGTGTKLIYDALT
ncbi:MAG: sulfite exporter TauE/SafE family protein [Maritimibacter sp.]